MDLLRKLCEAGSRRRGRRPRRPAQNAPIIRTIPGRIRTNLVGRDAHIAPRGTHPIQPPYSGESALHHRRGRRPRRPAQSWVNQLPDYGAFAAHPVHCRGDLRPPADDAAHEKRTVGRWLAAAETAEMVTAAPRDRPTASMKSIRIRRNGIIISDSPARATAGRPYSRFVC